MTSRQQSLFKLFYLVNNFKFRSLTDRQVGKDSHPLDSFSVWFRPPSRPLGAEVETVEQC